MGIFRGCGAICLTSEGFDDAVVGRVLTEVFEPKKSIPLAFEHVRDPAEGVIEVPYRNPDTIFCVYTRKSSL